MNRVHEPGSRTMSKNRLKNSTESKLGQNRLSAPSAQPTGPAACPGRLTGHAPRACCLCPCALRTLHARCAPRARYAPRVRPRSSRASLRAPRRALMPLPCAPAAPREPLRRAAHACAQRPGPNCLARAPQPPVRPTLACAPAPYAQWAVAHFKFCIYKFFFSLFFFL